MLAVGRGEEPQRLLTDLIRQMSQTALPSWRADLLTRIERFQPKRRTQLRDLLDDQTHTAGSLVRESANPGFEDHSLSAGVADLPGEDAFREALVKLSEHHIFQWSSHYAECLTHHFDQFLSYLKQRPRAGDYADAVRRPLEDHALDIFSKGYGYQLERVGQLAAMQKSIGGLARFLELPLEYYSARSSDVVDRDSVQALRSLFSSSFRGIVHGYASVQFANGTGATALPQHFKRFAHYLAFLEPAVTDDVADLIADDDVAHRLRRTLVPLLESLEKLIQKDHKDYYPIPIFGRYLDSRGRFEIGVRAPQSVTSRHAIEAHAYLGYEHVTVHALTEALASRVALVVAPLPPDVAAHVKADRQLADMVVRAGEGQEDVVQESVHAWDRAIYARRSRLAQARPYNIAREFPLHEPAKAKFYHVQRTSVRDLLRTFDRKNGVRLWCSVRRSGKTTACFDLDFTDGNSVIVPQTCGTEPTPRGRLFYDRIHEAVESKISIANDFVVDIVRECAPVSFEDDKRIVFVIDEYETLFAYLKAAATNNDLLRYTIVQPLLNQLVEFAQDNLLVFLGQQPDAHFILMDQNQLAPYVEQDRFPLFRHIHGTRAGEFGSLVRKILSDHYDVNPDFLDALHRETAGHPFLTVNVLCVLVDWLLATRRSLRGFSLHKPLFQDFRKEKFNLGQLMLHEDLSFFRGAAREAMSEYGYRANPWLHATYWSLRQIAMTDYSNLTVSRSDFVELMNCIPAPGDLPDANDILRKASRANFLRVSDDQVSVKIGILGRIAASVQPAQL